MILKQQTRVGKMGAVEWQLLPDYIESTGQVSIAKRRAQMPPIDIHRDGLYCGSPIQDYNGPDRRVTNIHQTKEFQHNYVINKAEERMTGGGGGGVGVHHHDLKLTEH